VTLCLCAKSVSYVATALTRSLDFPSKKCEHFNLQANITQT
jgi:hypothetical protein